MAHHGFMAAAGAQIKMLVNHKLSQATSATKGKAPVWGGFAIGCCSSIVNGIGPLEQATQASARLLTNYMESRTISREGTSGNPSRNGTKPFTGHVRSWLAGRLVGG